MWAEVEDKGSCALRALRIVFHEAYMKRKSLYQIDKEIGRHLRRTSNLFTKKPLAESVWDGYKAESIAHLSKQGRMPLKLREIL